MTRYRVEVPKRYECECWVPARWGSSPKHDCPYCGGTGYTSDPAHKKGRSKGKEKNE